MSGWISESADAWLIRHLLECQVRDCRTCAKARARAVENE